MAKVKWQQIAEDDFKAEVGDYLLRVERLHTDSVWWEVNYLGEVIGGMWWDETRTGLIKEAKRRAVNCMKEHLKNSK